MSPLLQKVIILAGILVIFNLQEVRSLICYDCNSEYDPRCADPFDSFSIGEVNCSQKPTSDHLKDKYKPTLCRKTIQKVYGKIRVVRGCGYIPDERDDKECMKRSGTHDVQAIYCACTTDRCNGAQSTFMMTDSNKFVIFRALPLAFTTILITLVTNHNLIKNYL